MSKPLAVLDRIEGDLYRDRAGIGRLWKATAHFREGEHSAPLYLGGDVSVTPLADGYRLERGRDGAVVAIHHTLKGWSTRACIAGWLEETP